MRYFIAMCAFLWLVSCKKAEDRRCLKKSGDYTQISIDLEPFNRLALREHIEYLLIQDSTDKVVVKGGKNLIGFIQFENKDGLLDISNLNRCNYLRQYEIVIVEIHYTSLVNILYEGTDDLKTLDTLETNYLTLTMRDGGGSVNLMVKALDLNIVNTHGWGDLTLKGSTNTARLHLMGDGTFDTRSLFVRDSLSMICSSSTPQKIGVQGIPIKVEINGMGNVEYYGFPSFIYFSRYGKGNLINKN